jgi:hypothetical protein
MGFNADSYIAKIAVDELAGKAAGYNPVSLPSRKIMERSAQGKMNIPSSCSRYAHWSNRRYPELGIYKLLYTMC